nr:hypothetical protein CFP56_00263 [Quercus suber]
MKEVVILLQTVSCYECRSHHGRCWARVCWADETKALLDEQRLYPPGEIAMARRGSLPIAYIVSPVSWLSTVGRKISSSLVVDSCWPPNRELDSVNLAKGSLAWDRGEHNRRCRVAGPFSPYSQLCHSNHVHPMLIFSMQSMLRGCLTRYLVTIHGEGDVLNGSRCSDRTHIARRPVHDGSLAQDWNKTFSLRKLTAELSDFQISLYFTTNRRRIFAVMREKLAAR